jgi:hypothetical protein
MSAEPFFIVPSLLLNYHHHLDDGRLLFTEIFVLFLFPYDTVGCAYSLDAIMFPSPQKKNKTKQKKYSYMNLYVLAIAKRKRVSIVDNNKVRFKRRNTTAGTKVVI